MIPTQSRRLIYDLSFDELSEVVETWGELKFRTVQIWKGLYDTLWDAPQDHSLDRTSNWSVLSKELRSRLKEEFSFSHLIPESTLKSADGETIKHLFRLADGDAIESVLMHYNPPGGDERNSICVSTQVGCAIGCQFCATGQVGFRRNLSAGEIVEQILFFARQLRQSGQNITNVVFMGMGEPFLNYENTLKAIDILNHEQGLNLGQRRFTISTVGIIPGIERFMAERRQVNLAVSLHAVENELRTRLIPINKKYPLGDLFSVCRKYTNLTGRRITFEWALIKEVNDSQDQAKKLAKALKGMLCHVNLIPLNPTHGYGGQVSPQDNAHQFQRTLESNGIACTLRLRRGIDIQAGCGQLFTNAIAKPVE